MTMLTNFVASLFIPNLEPTATVKILFHKSSARTVLSYLHNNFGNDFRLLILRIDLLVERSIFVNEHTKSFIASCFKEQRGRDAQGLNEKDNLQADNDNCCKVLL